MLLATQRQRRWDLCERGTHATAQCAAEAEAAARELLGAGEAVLDLRTRHTATATGEATVG